VNRLLILIWLVFLPSGRAQSTNLLDPRLLKTAQSAIGTNATLAEIKTAIGKGLWNSNKTALAITIPKPHPKPTIIFAFLRKTDGNFIAADLGPQESGNFVQVGLARRDHYERFETKPREWRIGNDGCFEVDVFTRMWKNRKRYTGKSSVLISQEGKVFWR
jgi:hypothetical protein